MKGAPTVSDRENDGMTKSDEDLGVAQLSRICGLFEKETNPGELSLETVAKPFSTKMSAPYCQLSPSVSPIKVRKMNPRKMSKDRSQDPSMHTMRASA